MAAPMAGAGCCERLAGVCLTPHKWAQTGTCLLQGATQCCTAGGRSLVSAGRAGVALTGSLLTARGPAAATVSSMRLQVP